MDGAITVGEYAAGADRVCNAPLSEAAGGPEAGEAGKLCLQLAFLSVLLEEVTRTLSWVAVPLCLPR